MTCVRVEDADDLLCHGPGTKHEDVYVLFVVEKEVERRRRKQSGSHVGDIGTIDNADRRAAMPSPRRIHTPSNLG